MKKLILSAIVLAMIVTTQANGEILKCKGSIVNSLNEFDKRITVHIDLVIPADTAEEFVLTLADKESKQFKSLFNHNPLVRKSFMEITSFLDKDDKNQRPERYEFIVTKMPDNNNSLYGFIYGYTPWVLKVDTWMERKQTIFFFSSGSINSRLLQITSS